MQEKYAAIEVYKSFERTKETISYYIINEDENQYGLKISREQQQRPKTKNDEIIIHNVANEKSTVEKLIDILLQTNNDLSQMSYIIQDYMHNNKYAII